MNVETITLLISILSPLIALLGSGTVVYVAWRKTGSEKRDLDGSAAERFEGIAARSALRIDTLEKNTKELQEWKEKACEKIEHMEMNNLDLTKRLEESETAQAALLEENAELKVAQKSAEDRIEKLERENKELKDYIERLSHQILSLGATPVPMKKTNKGEKDT